MLLTTRAATSVFPFYHYKFYDYGCVPKFTVQNSPVLKIYNTRYVNYRFSALTVNFGTQPTYVDA